MDKVKIEDRMMEEMGNFFDGAEEISEAKTPKVQEWWDKLPKQKKSKLVDDLGLDGDILKQEWNELDDDVTSELDAYYKKHKGKVECIEEADEGQVDLSFMDNVLKVPELRALVLVARKDAKKLGDSKDTKQDAQIREFWKAFKDIIGIFLSTYKTTVSGSGRARKLKSALKAHVNAIEV